MKILAVDTATESCSVAVVENEALRAEFTDVSGQTHSRHLMGLIERALVTSGHTLRQMDAIAVTRGPGSFTGLRIGISVVKGLVSGLGGIPVVGVSCLEALAHQVGPTTEMICPMLDARRNELYYAAYRRIDGGLVSVLEEGVGAPGMVVDKLSTPCLMVGNGCVKYRGRIVDRLGDAAQFAPFFMNAIRAAAVADLGLQRLRRGAGDDVTTLTPLYLRKSDAEVNLEKKRGERPDF